MFDEFNKTIEKKNMSKGISSIEIKVVANDTQGEINITDLMLQGGSSTTTWAYHPSEIRWSHDG